MDLRNKKIGDVINKTPMALSNFNKVSPTTMESLKLPRDQPHLDGIEKGQKASLWFERYKDAEGNPVVLILALVIIDDKNE
jgi:hypothetical protein